MTLVTLAIARLTWANGIRQPVVWLATGIGLLVLLLSLLFGQSNFEDADRLRLLLTAGVAAITLNGLFLGVLTASEAVHDELGSRTALTLFAKPVGRGAFLLGKALGAWATAACSCLLLAVCHLLLVWIVDRWGFVLDVGPGRAVDVSAPYGRLLAAQAAALAQVAMLTCLAASLALRLPLIANLVVVAGCFVCAHLLGGFGQQGLVAIPALGLFNLDEPLQFADVALGWRYLALGLAYAGLYSAGSLLIGMALFKHQDIA